MGLKMLSKAMVLTGVVSGSLFFVKIANAQETQVISYKDAAKYNDQVVTVEGEVSRVRDTAEYKFLDFFSEGKTIFTVVIPKDAFDKFNFDLRKTYLHKKIRVQGKITKYEDKPEIVVVDPGQIAILK